MDEWINNMWYIHTHIYIYIHNGILLSREKEGNPTICDKMHGL